MVGVDVPTLILSIAILSTVLSVVVGWVSLHNAGRGLRWLSLSLVFHAIGYVSAFLEIVTHAGPWRAIQDISVPLAFAMGVVAVADFCARRIWRAGVVGGTVIISVVCAAFPSLEMLRAGLITLVFIVFDIWMYWSLWRGWREGKAGRSHVLIVAGLTANLAVMFMREAGIIYQYYGGVWRGGMGLLEVLSQFSVIAGITLFAMGFLLMIRDSSDVRLSNMALTDRLTGVWNRFKIDEVVSQEMKQHASLGVSLSAILFDIDHFKAINDAYGHAEGDAVLREFAQRMRDCVRDTDVVGRWGGEEFIVLLPRSNLSTAIDIAERIRVSVSAKTFPNEISVTASAGVAECSLGEAWLDWFGRADAALYRAKHGGRNRICADDSSTSRETKHG